MEAVWGQRTYVEPARWCLKFRALLDLFFERKVWES